MTVSTMHEDTIAKIQQEQRDAGEAVHPGADEARLRALVADARARLGAEVPADYLELLRRVDGLDFNGLVLYDSHSSPEQPTGHFWQGLVAANLAWRDDPANAQCLVFGDTDIDLLLLDLPSGEYRRVDRVGRDLVQTYASLREMLDAVLAERLA